MRDRLIAGAMVPATLVTRRRNSAAGIASECSNCSRRCDAILAPATPCTAPKIGQQTFMLDGVELPVRPNMGLYTQPISFIGLPVVAVPVPLKPMPIGVQIIAAPWREDVALRIAYALEKIGAAEALGARRGVFHPLIPAQAGIEESRARSGAPPEGGRAATAGRHEMDIDLPEVVAEVSEAFDAYEKALVEKRRAGARRAVPRR